MFVTANVGALTHLMPAVLLHWIAYILASLLTLLICNRYLRVSNSVLALNCVFNNRKDLTMLLIALSSAAGLPPFFGFWTKTVILMFIGKTGSITIIAACWVIAVIALLFYINTLRYAISFKKQVADHVVTVDATTVEVSIAALLVLGSVLLNDVAAIAAIIFL